MMASQGPGVVDRIRASFVRRGRRLLRKLVGKPAKPRNEQEELEARVALTLSCRDCDDLPRVADAGQTIVEGDVRYQVMHNGVKILADGYYGEWMSRLIAGLRGVHEPQEERVFHEVLQQVRDDAVMIELGSYWGYYSLWFRHRHPERRCLLIEPMAERMEVGQRNFALNGYDAEFIQGYIGAPDGSGVTGLPPDASLAEAAEICFDRFIEERGIDFVDILHADIQGAEHDLLCAARESIAAGKIGYVFISTHQDKHDPCLEFLRTEGFEIIAEHSPEESYSVDGLIAARSPRVPRVPPVAISARGRPD